MPPGMVERAVEAGDDVVDHDLAVAGRIGGRAARERIRAERDPDAADQFVDGHGSIAVTVGFAHHQRRRAPAPDEQRGDGHHLRKSFAHLMRVARSLKCCKAHSASGHASGSDGQFLTPSITRVRCRPEEV
jgi:hypothetical protein